MVTVARLAILTVLVLVIGCDEASEPVPTSTASASVSATVVAPSASSTPASSTSAPSTPTPKVDPTAAPDNVTLYAADSRTGIETVDVLINAVLMSASDELVGLLLMTPTACVAEREHTDQLLCDDGESVGTEVPTFPFLQCQGFRAREPAPVIEQMLSGIDGLYAVATPDEPRDSSPPGGPAPVGDYRVVFGGRLPSGVMNGYAFDVRSDGAILAVGLDCGPPANHLRSEWELLLPPL